MNEHHLKLLKELSQDHTLSQRELSKKLGISLGKVNYVLNALLDKGLVKSKSFKNSKNKLAYMYILTPRGMAKKMELTYLFLQVKVREYDVLKREIEEMQREIDGPQAEGAKYFSSDERRNGGAGNRPGQAG